MVDSCIVPGMVSEELLRLVEMLYKRHCPRNVKSFSLICRFVGGCAITQFEYISFNGKQEPIQISEDVANELRKLFSEFTCQPDEPLQSLSMNVMSNGTYQIEYSN
ncbi:hypothetical protein [Photobacterium damselae]|uniref:Uncharacterized protein n=1 Tax=Photobacterium damselae subsp. damselae TaxID=85581 RepID=A0AAD3WYP6_PHODD|nr:hypothetical protein [Photobacterium damselae]AWK84551.1 hypothetical protein BST98_21185 [Photobacterium damselae]KAB1184344.1 hypothetical protein F6450_02285 [Photobacterium damselae subsp. damselae]NVO60224.1 hypothetical protein [Photobacterium damselae subsp. damselae]PSB89249.1 hypothetical protein C5F64_06300 [Photobacterium damselae subsp. damselae]TLS89831.1 hypothetical protein FD720_01295 [Photobacterium damselae subsp. damselae]